MVKAHGWRAEVKRYGWRGMSQEGRRGFMGPPAQVWVSAFAHEKRKASAQFNLHTSTSDMQKAVRNQRAKRLIDVEEIRRKDCVRQLAAADAGRMKGDVLLAMSGQRGDANSDVKQQTVISTAKIKDALKCLFKYCISCFPLAHKDNSLEY
jgi:hypothetical protein